MTLFYEARSADCLNSTLFHTTRPPHFIIPGIPEGWTLHKRTVFPAPNGEQIQQPRYRSFPKMAKVTVPRPPRGFYKGGQG
mmetsp:Transcript_130158/g.225035  ORF Transcript_130158/g.225035 Transcript_130158/m.225035 type:complete len:81 (+) Transcript_130158:363-605(+)